MAPTQDTLNRVKAVMDQYGVPVKVWYPIMMVESAGNPKALNSVDLNGVSSIGLFQMNLKGQGAAYKNNPSALYDIELNSTIAAKTFAAALAVVRDKYPDEKIAGEVAIRSGHPGGFPNSPYYGNGMDIYRLANTYWNKLPVFDGSTPTTPTAPGSGTPDITEPSSNPITQTTDLLANISAILSYFQVNAATLFARGILVALSIPIILIGAYLLVKSMGSE